MRGMENKALQISHECDFDTLSGLAYQGRGN